MSKDEYLEADEPDFYNKEEETKKELAELEKKDAEEDKKADAKELEDGVTEMSAAEIAAMTSTEKTPEKKIPTSKKPSGKKFSKTNTPIVKHDVNIIDAEKSLLYYYPDVKEWEKIHTLKPKRIIFYFTMTREEYKELFLCQVKYGSKIIGSTGARVI